MKLSQGEKLILLALASKEDGKEPIDLDFIRSAILSGNTWALTWELSGIPSEDVDPKVAEEVADILGMWSFIEHCISEMSEDDRAALKEAVYPYALEFEGFDGNHDVHHGVASFMVQDMGRFDQFQGRAMNSHTQTSLPHYRRMLPYYRDALKETGFSSRKLTADQIATVIKSGRE